MSSDSSSSAEEAVSSSESGGRDGGKEIFPLGGTEESSKPTRGRTVQLHVETASVGVSPSCRQRQSETSTYGTGMCVGWGRVVVC